MDSMPGFPEEEWDLFEVQGYFDTGMEGADDFQYITRFFQESGLTLVNMKPDDSLVGGDHARGRQVPQVAKCIHNDSIYIIYLANPDQAGEISSNQRKYEFIRKENADYTSLHISIRLPEMPFSFDWYNPRSGEWEVSGTIKGGDVELEAPGNEEYNQLSGIDSPWHIIQKEPARKWDIYLVNIFK